MTRYATIKDLRRNISPDVADESAVALAALRAEMAQEAAAYLQPARTAERAALDNAGSLGGAVPLEHDEQAALFRWAEANEGAHPELAMLHATPNGGYRPVHTAVMLKAEGVKAGYPDISLDVPRGRFHGLRIELKRAGGVGRVSAEQQEWIDRLRYYGYCAVVCYGAADAQQCIMAYLQQDGAQ